MEKTIAIWLISALITFIILYFLIKAAVKNGALEAWKEIEKSKNSRKSIPEKLNHTEAQLHLQKQYEAGKISFEEYQKGWNAG